MPAKGDRLKTDQWLGVNDYLVAANGLYFATLQGDGNFVVYRGASPSDNHGPLWASASAAHYSLADGDYHIAMQSDGNLVCYRGRDPWDNRYGRAVVWAAASIASYPLKHGQYVAIMQSDSNFVVYREVDDPKAVFATTATDPIKDVVDITRIDYDVASARVLQSSPATLYRQTVHNDSDVSQRSTINDSESISETSGWSDSLAVKVGVSTSFKTGVPVIAEGKVTVSMDVTNTYTWNGSETKTRTWGFNTPVNVPPHAAAVVLISVTVSTIAVPYTLYGTFVLNSGVQIRGQVGGVYTGTSSHDLTATFTPVGSGVAEVRPTTLALRGT